LAQLRRDSAVTVAILFLAQLRRVRRDRMKFVGSSTRRNFPFLFYFLQLKCLQEKEPY
jgi:hypothetical protein